MTKTRVYGAVVDEYRLTLYKEDGSTIEIPQGDPRLQKIVDEITPKLLAYDGAYADIDLSEENHYQQFEEKTGGLVRFFRVAKKAVTSFFTPPKPVKLMAVGSTHAPIMDIQSQLTEDKVEEAKPEVKQVQSAVAEIIKNAKPSSTSGFANKMDDSETVVAVVKNSKGEDKIIPDAHHLKDQICSLQSSWFYQGY